MTATPGVAGDTLHCQTPTHPNKAGVDPTAVALEVTLNGQQHRRRRPSSTASARPASSPVSPVRRRHLCHDRDGVGRRRLAPPLPLPLPQLPRPDELRGVRWIGGVDDATVGATTDASVGPFGDTLLCASPVWPGTTQPAALEVSLNGQQFTTDGRATTSRPPTIDVVYPLDGPAAGGTYALLTGTEFHDFAGAQGKGWGTDRRRFGELLAPTTLVEETKVRCVSRRSRSSRRRASTASTLRAMRCRTPAARRRRRIADGVLKLTAASEFQTGSFACAAVRHRGAHVVRGRV